MTEGLERLKRKRATIRAATTRLLTRLEDEVGKERPDSDKLREFLAVLSSKEDSLLDLDKGIEDVTPTDDLDTEISSTMDYMDRVLTWKVRATTTIGHQETIRDTPRVRVSDGSSGPKHIAVELENMVETLNRDVRGSEGVDAPQVCSAV
uniref:Uncharacterized protein n=1 Tax=Knipowitschia caucasica TaxID=637954 RepID=A0AAV2M8V3_KNICA